MSKTKKIKNCVIHLDAKNINTNFKKNILKNISMDYRNLKFSGQCVIPTDAKIKINMEDEITPKMKINDSSMKTVISNEVNCH